ncbi:Uncharacterised protein [Mycobacteroides abscessus subsp. abscessus]|jgi:hypothetical protein|nr:Uncharacterised protein [Mycobacteroides abscessus subsp. abscessus]SKL79978.1 Uncharacterised protein [Mycobacteroides abscessus subsp. abscessus]SKM53570.1 Uncharacterised protein [Mycobacteroides abscessus subsp. abscessus]SLK34909.1 Uncharacterised protein [Mycobacteroides abscessus subsp. abscessus]
MLQELWLIDSQIRFKAPKVGKLFDESLEPMLRRRDELMDMLRERGAEPWFYDCKKDSSWLVVKPPNW